MNSDNSDTVKMSVQNYHDDTSNLHKDTLVNIPKKEPIDYYKTDFLIGIPTSIIKFMVTDLEKGDQCFLQVEKLKEENGSLKKKNEYLSSVIVEYESILELNQNTIKNLTISNAKYKKQSKVFKIVAGALLVGFLLKVPEL